MVSTLLAVWAYEGPLAGVGHAVLLVRHDRLEGGLANVALSHQASVMHLLGYICLSLC